ncbi:MAG TPA: hypothetical protein VJZ27_14875, partial [Aggregatilineales bacterium]|nr:hypothetical protein [Aggregatilineales bacterium]
YHGSYLMRMAQALPGSRKNWIIQGEEGSIDIRPGKKTRIYQAVGDGMVETMIDAADYGFDEVIPLEMPNDAAAHARRIYQLLNDNPESDPAIRQIILTAGVHLWMVDAVPDVRAGIERAKALIESGAVLAIIEPKTTRIANP